MIGIIFRFLMLQTSCVEGSDCARSCTVLSISLKDYYGSPCRHPCPYCWMLDRPQKLEVFAQGRGCRWCQTPPTVICQPLDPRLRFDHCNSQIKIFMTSWGWCVWVVGKDYGFCCSNFKVTEDQRLFKTFKQFQRKGGHSQILKILGVSRVFKKRILN